MQTHRNLLIGSAVAVGLVVLFGAVADSAKESRLNTTFSGVEAIKDFGIGGCLSWMSGPVAMAAEQYEMLASSASEIALGEGPVEVTLAAARSSGAATLASRLSAAKPGEKFYLILKGLRTNEQPETLYRIYLEPSRGPTSAQPGPYNVGSLNFFNASNEIDPMRVYSYDVTELVKTLQARSLIGDSLTVTFVPTSKPDKNAKPIVGEISLVRQ